MVRREVTTSNRVRFPQAVQRYRTDAEVSTTPRYPAPNHLPGPRVPNRCSLHSHSMTVAVQGSFDDLGTSLSQVTFVVLDVETTGGSPATASLTEVAAARFRGGELLGTYQTFVRPDQRIPPFITELTGISEAMVADAPRVGEMLPSFLEFVGGAVLVGHNLRFDLSFLDHALVSTGREPLANTTVDTLAMARRLVRDAVPNCRLGTLAATLSLTHQPSHRALTDVLATADLLHALLEHAGSYGILGLAELLELPKLVGHPHASKLRLTTRLPHRAGVYWFTDAAGNVLYVGKGPDIRAQVRGHFSSDARSNAGRVLRPLHAVHHRACACPLSSAILEARLLERWSPPYNRSGHARRSRRKVAKPGDRTRSQGAASSSDASRETLISDSSTAAARPSSITSEASATPAARSGALPMTVKAAAALSTATSRCGDDVPGQHPSDGRRVERGVSTAEILDGDQRQSEFRGIDPVGGSAVLAVGRPDQLMHGRGTGRAELVEAVVAVDHHPPQRAVCREHADHLVGHRGIGDADYLVTGPTRVCQRTEIVEDGRDPELLAHGSGVAHRGMEPGREAKAHADLLDAPLDAGRAEVGDDAQLLQHVGRTHRGRGGPSPVLAHLGPGRRDHQRCDGRDVDAAKAVATGAAGVDHLGAGREVEPHPVGNHGADESGHLLGRLALRPQGGGERGDLRGSRVAREDLSEDDLGFDDVQRVAREQPAQDPGPSSERGERRSVVHAQSHQRSCASTPRAMRPSCTCEVPSTMVSCLASRYQSSVGWSSMYPAAPRSWSATPDARTASSVA